MSAYLPTEASVIVVLGASLAFVIVAGHVLSRGKIHSARWMAWAMLIFGTFGVERLVAREPAGLRMLALVTFSLLAMKVVVVVQERARGMAPLAFSAWLGFSGAWLGMQPRPFATPQDTPLPGASALTRRGIMRALAGAALLLLARLAFVAVGSGLLATALALTGLSLVLHFGVCNLLAGAWRRRGIACDALFRAPLNSQNLGEFWARRWNIGFSEMTVSAVYQPLAERWGRAVALLGAFAFSGLLHELALSVPVRAGFGLPMTYFMAHGALVFLERALAKAGRPLLGWAGRSWALFWLAAPLPLLFHPPFLAGVIWPLIGIE